MFKQHFFLNLFPITITTYYLRVIHNLITNDDLNAQTHSTDAEPNMATFLLMISLIGGIIILTLAYVSWRKYKGELKKRRSKDKSKL